jgi:hypothetical protein
MTFKYLGVFILLENNKCLYMEGRKSYARNNECSSGQNEGKQNL